MKKSFMGLWTLANRIFMRDYKSGELNILLLSLLIATATVTAISLFTSRIENSIVDEASEFLAADAKIQGTQPIPENLRQAAATQLLQSSDFIEFRAMAFAGDDMVLSQVKAVDEHYPLKGELEIAETIYGESEGRSRKTARGPATGKAWIAPRVFHALNVKVGDQIDIGEASFEIEASLVKEPDSTQSFFGVSPRILINIADVEKTQAVQFGSRVNYAWLLMGETSALASMKDTFEKSDDKHHRWVDVKSGNRSIAGALDRAESFLLLAGCLSVLLAGVAIALAARRYAKRQQKQVALLKTFGHTPADITRLYSFNLFYLASFALICGSLSGWLLHLLIIYFLGDLIPHNLAAPQLTAFFTGGLSGFTALLAFAAPPLMSLRFVSPVSIIRDDDTLAINTRTSTIIGSLAMIFLILIYSKSVKLTFFITLAVIACIVGVGLLSALMMHAIGPLGKKMSKNWRLGLANLKRHQQMNTSQIMVFAILLFLLFSMTSIRSSLLNQWQDQIPEHAPNHFVFNIFPNEAPAIETFLQEHDISHSPFYPMIRGRVYKVGEKLVEDLAEEAENNNNYERELNLTWSDTYGKDNKIIAGKWWDSAPQPGATPQNIQASVEEEYAAGIGITVGDQLELSVAGQTVIARVSSLRSVQWDSMNPNFFIIFNQPLLEGAGANWLTSFYLPLERKRVLNQLVKQHPTVSLIEVDQTIAQVRSIVAQISLAVEFILLLILISGFLVLISSIQSTLDIRLHESAILRTLGAKRSMVRHILLIEFGALGLLAGLLAAAGSEICLFFLQTQIFDLPYVFQGMIWLIGPELSAVAIALVGWFSTRKVVNTPPLASLRQI
ncbi:hypothetical protein TDB9533_01921 [Thalassocella blandensis]|nr:hypothetical protein TDB9533_01921 [Thalassocella blandensis]